MTILRFWVVISMMAAGLMLCGFKKHHPRIKPKPPSPPVIQSHPLDLTMSNYLLAINGEPKPPSHTDKYSLFNPAFGKRRPLELRGQVIMSQEPEAGKTRSADGAGITINVHP